MQEFKVGDRVRYVGVYGSAPRGSRGTIVDIWDNDFNVVDFDVIGQRRGILDESLQLITKENMLDNLKVGDILVDEDGDEAMVLEVGASGKTVLLSALDMFDKADEWETITELKRDGWKLKDTSDIEELTVEEISKRLGRTIKVVN